MLQTMRKTSVTRVHVDPEAIRANVHLLTSRLPEGGQLMPMIKSDGYGAGVLVMHEILRECGVSRFGLATLDEVLPLRATGVMDTLFVTAIAPDEAEGAVEMNVQPGVGRPETVRALAAAAKAAGSQIRVHLHINTGMNRFGCLPHEAAEMLQTIADCAPWVELEGILTHLAAADDPESDAFTQEQLFKFHGVLADAPKVNAIHAANSAALLRFDLPRCNVARPGLAILGLQPSTVTTHFKLRPAVTLTSQIVHINQCVAGDTVGYLRRYRVNRPTERIAVIPVGYADGWRRSWGGKGLFLVNGKPAPMVGVVCMNHQMIDVTDVPDVRPGDEVTLFSPEWSLEEQADRMDTIPHELITMLKALRN